MKNSFKKSNNVKVSYWDKKEFLDNKDIIIIGSGLVGLFTAYHIRKKFPKTKILVLERGVLPHGASTKNAGFACFGSPSEIFDDLKKIPEDTVWQTIAMRWNGLKKLRSILGDGNIGFEPVGGFECFDDKYEFLEMLEFSNLLNKKLKTFIGKNDVYDDYSVHLKDYGFGKIVGLIRNKYEAGIQTGRMMQSLLTLCREAGIEILNGITVEQIQECNDGVEVHTDFYHFKVPNVVIATNGFASAITGRKDVLPARAQVLITEKIKGLNWKGTFHMDKGYYYFRELDGRVLLGGGRNLDFKTETTTDFELTEKIQLKLEELLQRVILPRKKFRIEQRWAGIMGVGPEKKPIIEWHSERVLIAVRMGGMGVAIGSVVGEMAAEKLKERL